jgi:surfeit locus 1 family protein
VSPADGDRHPQRSFGVLCLLGVIAILVIAGFVALGVWQVHRLAWKVDLIAKIEQRIHAPPIDAPGRAVWPSIDASHDVYRRVRVEGVFLNERETLVQAVTALGGGYWVMTPLLTDRGFIVLVNRGFVPPDFQNPATRTGRQITGHAEVTGLLRITEPKGGFLRSNDPAEGRWYSRDVAAIAQARHLNDAAPYFIDADATPSGSGAPVGGLTAVDLPNNHLAYALTWFALAAMATGAAAFVALDESKRRFVAKVQETESRQIPPSLGT